MRFWAELLSLLVLVLLHVHVYTRRVEACAYFESNVVTHIHRVYDIYDTAEIGIWSTA